MKIEWDERYEFIDPPSADAQQWVMRELVKEVERLGLDVNTRMLGVPDGFPDGGWCIHMEDDVWLVYHSERGRRSRPNVFTSGFDAANYYVWSLICSPSADNSSVGCLPRTAGPF